jgi:GT2 family glycosyltransferase
VAGIAIIVATRDRAAMLERLLGSALAMSAASPDELELIVADNGSRDATRDVVARTGAHHRGIRYLWAPEGGKARALNQAVRATTAPMLGFVDDDVTFDSGWLTAATRCVRTAAPGAAQGRILLPPEVAADAPLAREVARWGTIPCRDYGPDARTAPSLTGANMLIARATFARIGLFDERLGPGAAGACEDTELALRVQAAGVAIAWVPDAIVYHAVERDRLGPAYFRSMHELRGRSRVYYKRSVASRIVPNLGLAALGVASTVFREQAHRRALGRWYHYRAMLAVHRAPRLPGGVPRLEDGA